MMNAAWRYGYKKCDSTSLRLILFYHYVSQNQTILLNVTIYETQTQSFLPVDLSKSLFVFFEFYKSYSRWTVQDHNYELLQSVR